MKNRFILSFLFLSLLMITSCEKDEICILENTPRMIIRFYDFDDQQNYKPVNNIGVIVDDVEVYYLDSGISSTTDSIIVPLSVENDFSKIKLVLNGLDTDTDNDSIDVVNASYIRNAEYVSRSCGYKMLYDEVEVDLETNPNNWIKKIETVRNIQNIIDENQKHIRIYH